MRTVVILGLAMAVAVAAASAGCREDEGVLEKAGRQFDEVVDDVTKKARELGGEGAMERIGRHMDEAAEQTKEAVEEAVDALEELGE